MKKIFLLFVMLICGISINAQVTVSEPEFADETLLLTSNGCPLYHSDSDGEKRVADR